MKGKRRARTSAGELTSVEMARLAANAAYDTKAEDIVVLKVEGIVDYTDYLVIASGRSTRQAQSIAENVRKAIAGCGGRIIGIEGEREGNWILIDWGSVIVHVFYAPVREFYELEKLWGDAKKIKLGSELDN